MQNSEKELPVSDVKISGVSNLSKYKLVFLGDQSVGKTSIINRFIFDTFDGRDHVAKLILMRLKILIAYSWN